MLKSFIFPFLNNCISMGIALKEKLLTFLNKVQVTVRTVNNVIWFKRWLSKVLFH